MLQRVRRFAIRLHKDESGPNTVEWVLLIIVALVVLVAIYWFWNEVVKPKLVEGAKAVEDTKFEEP